MELLVKKRSPIRANFTKCFNGLNDLLKADNVKEESIKSNFANLRRIYSQLTEIDQEISSLLLEDTDDKKYQNEYAIIEEYNENFVKAEVNVEMYLNRISKTESSVDIYIS